MANKQQEITVQAPAKVNLFLAITAKRPDGYHEIETLMAKLDLADELTIALGGQGVRLSCPGSDLPEDSSNLAFRAAEAYIKRAGLAEGVEITLKKKVPVAAGLGGGSSDAAAVLCGLNDLVDAPLSEGELFELAKPLGADVPFFVAQANAVWATGIGEKLSMRKIDLMPWVVLVNPCFPVSTKWVYENFQLTTKGNPYILGRDLAQGDNFGSKTAEAITLYNDLESVTLAKYPQLVEIKETLLSDGAKAALMSGSGPTVFGLFADKAMAQASCEKFSRQYGQNVFLTSPLRST